MRCGSLFFLDGAAMAAAWTYSDWDTGYEDGSAAQLARLKLFIKEIRDWLSTGNVATEGKSHDKAFWMEEVRRLEVRRDKIQAQVDAAAGNKAYWTRGRAAL